MKMVTVSSIAKVVATVAAILPVAMGRALPGRGGNGNNNVVTITQVNTVTVPIHVNGYFKTDGVYSIESAFTFTVTDAPAVFRTDAYVTSLSTVTITSTKSPAAASSTSKSTTSTSTSTAKSTTSTSTAKSTTSTSTSKSTVSSTTTASSSVPTKTNVADCNVEGTVASSSAMPVFGTSSQNSFLDCQTSCFYATACESYSYNPSTKVCTEYNAPLDVKKSSTSGVWFSQKYPEDGSDFCYGTQGY